VMVSGGVATTLGLTVAARRGDLAAVPLLAGWALAGSCLDAGTVRLGRRDAAAALTWETATSGRVARALNVGLTGVAAVMGSGAIAARSRVAPRTAAQWRAFPRARFRAIRSPL
jgi:hypothetical protein